jgi:hypothetical protein
MGFPALEAPQDVAKRRAYMAAYFKRERPRDAGAKLKLSVPKLSQNRNFEVGADSMRRLSI